MTPIPPDSFVLTFDIGTSSLRTMLFDGDARALPGYESRAETPTRATADGGVEIDADVLLQRLSGCIDDLLLKAGPLAAHIAAVAGATLVGNVLGVDANGHAITPVYTWADTRSSAAAAELRSSLDESAVHDRTGCLLRSSYLPAQLRWIRRTFPDLWQRVQRWMSAADYAYLQLFGSTAVSFSVASWSGMLDRRLLRWDPELLDVSGITGDQLVPLVDRDVPFSGLQPQFARRWPSLASLPWYPAVGDGAASNTGCGCVHPHQMALALGTSGAVRVMVEHDIADIPQGLWVYRVDRRHSLVGGALSEGGNLFAWLHETLRLAPDVAAVEAEVAALTPDGHGLTVLPFLAGERSPGWHGSARAVIAGLGLHTRPVEVLKAGLESIGYRFAILSQLVHEAVPVVTEVIASGGPIWHSPAWAQIIADILGTPLQLSAETEATSRGVAILALSALANLHRLDQLPATTAHTSMPVPEHHAIYQAGLARHQHLYDLLIAGSQ